MTLRVTITHTEPENEFDLNVDVFDVTMDGDRVESTEKHRVSPGGSVDVSINSHRGFTVTETERG